MLPIYSSVPSVTVSLSSDSPALTRCGTYVQPSGVTVSILESGSSISTIPSWPNSFEPNVQTSVAPPFSVTITLCSLPAAIYLGVPVKPVTSAGSDTVVTATVSVTSSYNSGWASGSLSGSVLPAFSFLTVLVVEPCALPACPLELLPQAQTLPAVSIARLWLSPEAIWSILTPLPKFTL